MFGMFGMAGLASSLNGDGKSYRVKKPEIRAGGRQV